MDHLVGGAVDERDAVRSVLNGASQIGREKIERIRRGSPAELRSCQIQGVIDLAVIAIVEKHVDLGELLLEIRTGDDFHELADIVAGVVVVELIHEDISRRCTSTSSRSERESELKLGTRSHVQPADGHASGYRRAAGNRHPWQDC